MLRKYYPLVLLFVFVSARSSAQDWIKKMNDPSVNFYDVQQSFNKYWKKEQQKEKLKRIFSFSNKTEEENEGYTMYKRWENYVEPRVYPSGDRSLIQSGNEELQKLITNHAYRSSMLAGGNWSPMGAFTIPANGGGAGRLNAVAFDPTNLNRIFVGAPDGGLWNTTDGGTTWSTNTDALPSLGVSAIAIDPTDINIMYIGTGDIDGSDSYGVGVLKSIDAGATWSSTGLNWIVSQSRNINKLLINPNDHNMIFAGTTAGAYRSLDGGITWTKVLVTSGIKDMEFKPGDPTTVYAASAAGFYRSINSGVSFTLISSGMPLASVINRIAIAVTPADPSYVYLLLSSSADYGFKGLYLSGNSGSSFVLQSSSPNLLGYDWDGNDVGGNGWYTLSIDASPIDANEVIVGGVNAWKSSDAGQSWNIVSHWYGDHGLPYVHADIHNLIYRPDGSAIYATCDGGIFKTSDGGNSWQDKSSGLQIGELYRLGNSVTNANLVIQGWQDNGCNLYASGSWSHVVGGDGMEAFIDWSNSNYMYGEWQNGMLQRSVDGGLNFTDILNNISEPGQWITPWMQDPVNPQILYAGFENVWKTTDRGDNWTPISTFTSSGLTFLKVAKSNPLYIYAGTQNSIHKTTNGGTTWTTVTFPAGGAITDLEVNTTDPNIIWITRSGYTPTNKVFKSINGGASWTNISASLPNVPVNCCVNQTGTNDGIYIGTDLGVYYIDNDLSSWMPYSNGLPNVRIDELEIHYGSGKLRAATFGRGLWETGIHDPASNLPFANFTANVLSGCPGLIVNYSDSTFNTPTSWNWTFPGGTPSSSTLQNPVVTYNSPGTYNNATLVVSNAFGTDSLTKLSYIAVSPDVKPVISLNKNDSICQGQTVALSASSGNGYLWYPGLQTGPVIAVGVTGTYSVKVTDAFGCAGFSDTTTIFVYPLPPVPVISVNNDTLTSSYPDHNQWFSSGTLIPGATGQTYVLPWFGLTITVQYTDSVSGCSSVSAAFVGIEETNANGVTYSVFPNPTDGSSTLMIETATEDALNVQITDVLGRVVFDKPYDHFTGKKEMTIDLFGFGKGIYLLSVKNKKGVSAKKVVVD